MGDIEITIKNLPQIKAAFGRSPLLMMRELNKAIQRTVLQISSDSKYSTPVDTGRLRASTYTRFTNLSGEVGTNTEYDKFVHDGTKFMTGRPYLRQAVEKNKDSANRWFEQAVQNVLDQIGRAT